MIITNLPALTDVIVQSMSETLFEGYFKDEKIQEAYSIQTGIKAGKQVIVFKRHTGLAGFNRTGCSTTANDTWEIDAQEKSWAPKYVGDRFEMCYDDFLDTFFAWRNKNGVDKPDISGTELAAFIVEQLQDTISEVYMRLADFGDKGLAAGTGNNITAGQVKYFTPIDGFFAQLDDIVAADASRKSTTAGLTSRNGQVTYALQKFTTGAGSDTTNAVVTTALDAVWYDADMRLRGMDKNSLVYKVTQSVYDQYERERKAVGSIPEAYRRVEDGVLQLFCNGIEVKPMSHWDRIIAEFFGDDATPTSAVRPHRIWLTTRTNNIVGCEELADLSNFKAWFSDDDEKFYLRFGANIDVKIGADNLNQVAY